MKYLLLATLLVSFSANSAELFTKIDEKLISLDEKAKIDAIQKLPYTISYNLYVVNKESLNEKEIRLSLRDNISVIVTDFQAKGKPFIGNDKNISYVFVMNDVTLLTGSIKTSDSMYMLQPLNDTVIIAIKIDQAKFEKH